LANSAKAEDVRIHKTLNNSNMIQDFDCIITSDPDDAYNYLTENTAIRFAEKGQFEPNMEIKFVYYDTDFYSIENSIDVVCKNHIIRMGPFDIQIAYKLYMGSDKDIEDALYLYKVLREAIDIKKLNVFLLKLRVPKETIGKLGDLNES